MCNASCVNMQYYTINYYTLHDVQCMIMCITEITHYALDDAHRVIYMCNSVYMRCNTA